MKELLIRAALWTGDPARPRAQACVVRDGRFVFVGDFEAARAAYPAAEIADYGDNLAMPGMSDGHLHLTAFARQNLYVNLLHVRSLEETAAMLREKAAEVGSGAWIRAINYNEMAWPDTTPPSMEWLDSLGLDNPVILSRYCGHRHVANSRAMR